MKARLFVLSLILTVGLLIPGQIGMAAEHDMTIGAIVPTRAADGFRANLIGVEMTAEEHGVEVIKFGADRDVTKQTSQIEDLIERGVDAIVFIPVDSKAMAGAVESANEAGVPVVAMDRSVEGAELAGLVESDNVLHGSIAADLMVLSAEKQGIPLEELRVLELQGDMATSSAVERSEGFTSRAEALGVDVVTSLPTNWQADQAFESTLDAFSAHPEINAIFEASDIAMHSGVESALEQTGNLAKVGEEGHVIITAVDGGPSGIQAVGEGYIDAIAGQPLLTMGKKAAEIAIQIAKGEEPDQRFVRLSPNIASRSTAHLDVHWANKVENE